MLVAPVSLLVAAGALLLAQEISKTEQGRARAVSSA
jgi:hypothetical protein